MDKIGMVVNYYWPSPSKKGHELITLTTQLALLLLVENPVVGSVVLVDGSPEADGVMGDMCRRLGVNYLHTGQELGLAEGYNLGWRSLSEPYIGLMANDVLPHPPKTMEMLLEWIKRPDVGCVFPYLTDCDYTPQLKRLVDRLNATCEPAGMTLNLNVFKRCVLEDAGGVDEGYLVGFYDPILAIKIREMGYRVVEVGQASAIHLNRLTKDQEGSTLSDERWEADYAKFFREYPSYHAEHGHWNMTFWRWPFSTSITASVLWWLSQHWPTARFRYRLSTFTTWLEPFLTEYPARYGLRRMFSRPPVRKDKAEHHAD